MNPLPKSLAPLAALFLGLFGLQGLCAAATTISFTDATALEAAFPSASHAYTGMHGDPFVESSQLVLLAGDETKELTSGNRSGSVTVYSDAAYSSGLDFISSGLTLSLSDVDLTNSDGSISGRFGLTSTNSGTLSTGNGIYFDINRASNVNDNSLRLIQSVNGVETVLATASGVNIGQFNNATSISLTLTATTWSVSLNGGGATIDPLRSLSGTFATAWTEENWGGDAYIGLESLQLSTSGSKTRYSEVKFGDISFTQQVPEPGAAAMLAGLVALVFVGGKRLRRRR